MPENYQHLHFEVVGSTNDLCRIECKKELKPTLITADKQTEGRGRNQKRWESPKGNISFSYGFFCGKPHPALSLLAGLKTTIAIEKIFGKCVKLKWPNDLIYESKKIGGILVETENFEDKFLVVLGIGINLKVIPNEPHWGDLQSDWLANCVHMNSKIKIASSNEELFFQGIDHAGAALLKNTNGEIITYQESSLSVLNLY